MAVEVLKQQFADLTRDYTGACEAIRQLEANVAAYRDKLDDLTEQRADLQQDRARLRAARDAALLNHTAALLEVGRMRDETIALREQLTAAEAAREAVLASLAAAEAVAGEALKWAYRQLAHDHHYGFPLDPDKPDGVAFVARGLASLPTPSAALQRVREQAQREGAERALRYMYERQYPLYPDGAPHFGIDREDWEKGWGACKSVGLAALFPTPDAGGR